MLNLLIIPESRKRPLTGSLLYKQIIHFLQGEGLEKKFQIAFITISRGVIEIDAEGNEILNPKSEIRNKFKILKPKIQNLPPARFRSGGTWIKKEGIEGMARSIAAYIKTPRIVEQSSLRGRQEHKNPSTRAKLGTGQGIKIIAYVRGSYLEAIRLASKKFLLRQGYGGQAGIEIKELFTEEELAKLKKRGIKWMKVGLRMEEAFTIFKRRIKEILSEESSQTKNNQLRLPI